MRQDYFVKFFFHKINKKILNKHLHDYLHYVQTVLQLSVLHLWTVTSAPLDKCKKESPHRLNDSKPLRLTQEPCIWSQYWTKVESQCLTCWIGWNEHVGWKALSGATTVERTVRRDVQRVSYWHHQMTVGGL